MPKTRRRQMAAPAGAANELGGVMIRGQGGISAPLLGRLNRVCSRKLEYFGVRASFRTDRPGWKFWRYFVNLGDRAKEAGASLVFESENDLVVNTASMAVLAREPKQALIPADHICDFGVTDTVYHTVYFRQKETVKFLRDCLGMS